MTVKIIKKVGKKSEGYTEILYFDSAGNFCPENSATHFLMREYDSKGKITTQRWGITDKYKLG